MSHLETEHIKNIRRKIGLLQTLLKTVEKIPEQHKEHDPTELKKKIRHLEGQLKDIEQ
jgi:hypothetical protein